MVTSQGYDGLITSGLLNDQVISKPENYIGVLMGNEKHVKLLKIITRVHLHKWGPEPFRANGEFRNGGCP